MKKAKAGKAGGDGGGAAVGGAGKKAGGFAGKHLDNGE